MNLRPYQHDINRDILAAWNGGAKNVLAVLPTGAGKTITFSKIVADHGGASCVMAHRQELVGQISLALAKYGVRHSIIASNSIIRWIVSYHMSELGQSFYDPGSQCVVVGVQTLVRRADRLKAWRDRVSLWITDEAHHLLKINQWGKAVDLFPYARGLGVTATPCRADGNGLGRHADGVMDALVVGPTMRELINQGYLCDYRIFAPPSNLDLNGVNITRSGDVNAKQLVARTRESCIMGDIVEHYLRLAPGKIGVTFVPGVDIATDVAAAFNGAGVPAAVISAKTPDSIRIDLTRQLRRGDLKQLVNVDLFGEGFDLPAIEVTSMGRYTESFALFSQQFGRMGRIMDGKEYSILIDHVGNVERHAGTETDPETGKLYISLNRSWSLDRRERRTSTERDPDLIPVKTCKSCTAVFEAFYKVCPYCGAAIIPADRTSPKFVDGDLTELDPATLAAMRGEIDRIDAPAEAVQAKMEQYGGRSIAALGAAKQHRVRQEAQKILRDSIALWAGYQRYNLGRPDFESYRRFYFRYGVDVNTAQTLGKRDATELTKKIREDLQL